jgi:membrane associated rhomboid family serine protease
MTISKEQALAYVKSQFKEGDLIIKIILLNITIYLGLKLIAFIEWVFRLGFTPISGFITNWLYLPFNFQEALVKPYTLISYQFIHDDFFHLFINLILLFFFGKLLLKIIGLRKFLPLYILGGVFGGILFVFFSTTNFLPVAQKPMIGASASLMALMGASAFLLPNYILKFFFVFDVKLKWLVLAFGILNLMSVFSPESAGAGIVHVSGLLFGLGFMYLGSLGYDIALPFNKGLDYLLSLFNRKPKPKVSYVNPNPSVKKTAKSINQQEAIDAILDKIAANGYESLTKEEKDFLFKASKS